MSDVLLTLNAGSSNLKYSLWHLPDLISIEQGKIEFKPDKDLNLDAALVQLMDHIYESHGNKSVRIIGHRLVHGGTQFYEPTLLNESIEEQIKQLIPLAPLHLPSELAAIGFIARRYPEIKQVACFDTAFHKTQNSLYQQFALPKEYAKNGILRYGFHGLSYEYIASVAHECIDVQHRSRLIVAHLGNGASMCAMSDLKSVTTTMGFTALDGLMMGTRCGELDAGVVLYLMQYLGLNDQQIESILYKQSGLLGVSGISSDVRELEASNDKNASIALELFAFRAAQKLAGLIPALGGLDGIVFTGGIGENSAFIREKILFHLAWLGIQLDVNANQNHSSAIHAANSLVGIYRIPTNEEKMLATHTYTFLSQQIMRLS
ncbi:acetate/propionate family kinase [Sessilibacter corallicola]|uniref:Acetate kinase n=1 Tax=Sessilibacter corallicola TaxID=2904075 RepID=A0ABQ0A5P5_9GAMM